ncbi:hypothetical protein PPYC2_16465 [Paenibacillus polymyxa]|uniref:hypothetical protein n=1 Tax=Paenibacillus polymyxa TaxID=1406 RepID=UPI0008FB4AD6|nr:hypothetical protein [Paenibacillus polymyxa]APB76457.1 hypothetical protein PPYC2_16465 [Paenibacillus polymyxa]
MNDDFRPDHYIVKFIGGADNQDSIYTMTEPSIYGLYTDSKNGGNYSIVHVDKDKRQAYAVRWSEEDPFWKSFELWGKVKEMFEFIPNTFSKKEFEDEIRIKISDARMLFKQIETLLDNYNKDN